MNGSNGNGNGNGNGHKRIRLSLSDLKGEVGTLDFAPQTNGVSEAEGGVKRGTSDSDKATPDKDETERAAQGAGADVEGAEESEENLELLEQKEKRKRWKRVFLSFGIISCALVMILVVGYLWLFAGDDETYRVRNSPPRSQASGATNNSTQALTVEEIARELSNRNKNDNANAAAQENAPAQTTVTNGATLNGGSRITDRLPLGDYSATVNANSALNTSQTAPNVNAATGAGQVSKNADTQAGSENTRSSGLPNGAQIGNANPERSIRVSALDTRARDGAQYTGATEKQLRGDAPRDDRTEAVSLPPMGTMLPVRTLGAVYTLRSEGYVRMQLTREVSRRGWSLARGTELYGVVRNSDFEIGRAYVQLVGFIEPQQNRFVRLQGSVLGADGADGFRGRKHNLNSGWSRALRIAGAGMIEALSAVSAGIGRRPVYVGDVYGYGAPRVTSPLMRELNGIAYREGRAGFVEVPAGTSGYILVMTSPREVTGTDVDLSIENLRLQSDTASERDAARISESELAELMTNGSRDDIRRALPRMTPEMRRIAEAALAGQ